MIALFRKWIAPVSVSERIIVDGVILRATGHSSAKRSLYISRLRVYVPDCRSYVVEYLRDDDGEFVVENDRLGRVGIRSLIVPDYTIPVCWLPPGLRGIRVSRRIVRIDERRVRIRAGLSDAFRRRWTGRSGGAARAHDGKAGRSAAS